MVAIVKNKQIVSNVPASLSVLFSQFLARTCNEVSGGRVSQYGLRAPCKYTLVPRLEWSESSPESPEASIYYQTKSLVEKIITAKSTHSLAIE